MTTYGFIGGPEHESTSEGPVPDGYVRECAGKNLGPTYASALRRAKEIYRWKVDADYIDDGTRILDDYANRRIPGLDTLGETAYLMAGEALQQGLYAIKDSPETDEAQMGRQAIDTWREAGWPS